MTDESYKWETVLWEELDQQSETDQIVTCGKWIAHMTHALLPALGNRRRDRVVEVLARPDMDATKLAETIGSRRTAVSRLAEEGRARKREEQRDAGDGVEQSS